MIDPKDDPVDAPLHLRLLAVEEALDRFRAALDERGLDLVDFDLEPVAGTTDVRLVGRIEDGLGEVTG